MFWENVQELWKGERQSWRRGWKHNRTCILTGVNVSLIMTLLPFLPCVGRDEVSFMLCKTVSAPSLISLSSSCLSVGISFAEVISSFVPSLKNSVVCITLCKMQYCEELEYFLCWNLSVWYPLKIKEQTWHHGYYHVLFLFACCQNFHFYFILLPHCIWKAKIVLFTPLRLYGGFSRLLLCRFISTIQNITN